MKSKNGVFIVWKDYQRRVEVLAPLFGLEIRYFFYSWESKFKLLKALSYLLKSIDTLLYLFKIKPRLVFVQFPPPPALYCVAFYSWFSKARYVSDCHIGMTNAGWLNWLYVKKLLAQGPMIVHNDQLIAQVKRSIDVQPMVVRDGIAKTQSMRVSNETLLNELGLTRKGYVMVPCSFSPDEPLHEIVETARLLPNVTFVLTWHIEKFPKKLHNSLPRNILLTDYLSIEDYNRLFVDSGVALVLTKHENVQLSGMQEAMAFEIPAVVTDLVTTRLLYKDYPLYVQNHPTSIASGIECAFQNRTVLEESMKALRDESDKVFFDQIANLKSLLN